MHMIWHHHIAHKKESVLSPHSAEFLNEHVPCPRCPQQRQPPVATKRQKMKMSLPVVPLQALRHSTPKPPPSKTEGGAPPQRYSLMNYRGGILLSHGTVKRKEGAAPGPPVLQSLRHSTPTPPPSKNRGWCTPVTLLPDELQQWYPLIACRRQQNRKSSAWATRRHVLPPNLLAQWEPPVRTRATMDEQRILNACQLRDEGKFIEAYNEFIQIAESTPDPLDKAGALLYAANTLEMSGQCEAATTKLSAVRALMEDYPKSERDER